ncbi:MAG: LCP family protein [Acidimicrobiales bacterium]
MPSENSPPPSPNDHSESDDRFGLDDAPIGTRGRGRRFLVRSAVLIVLSGVVVAAAIVAWGLRRIGEITYVDVHGVEPTAGGSANNWLLIGTDGREGIDPNSPDAAAFLGEQVVGKRTDTIMLVRVDGDARSIDLLSIPRDLWVPIAGREGDGRINGAYNGVDGRQRLVATLSEALDVEINHYAEVNFVGFREIVDALEGVPLWFEYPARDVGSGLHIAEPGCHILDGSQALAYARSRTFEELVDGGWRLDPTGDLGRTTRQRTFLSRIIDTATGKLDVTELGTVDEVLAVGGRNLVVEDGASVADLLSLARTFASVGGDRIVGHSLPVEDHRTSGGAQVLRLQEAAAQPVLEVFRTGIAPSGPELEAAGQEQTGGSEQPGGTEPSSSNPEPGPVVMVDDPDGGYGRFGFVAASTPEGTPCR